jgi:prevent-host-death family protein
MAPQRKREVGVRELHDHLSKYVRYVAEGGEVLVTMRGRGVARLTPVEAVDPLADLRARGLVQAPLRDWAPRGSGRPVPSKSVADLVSEQRR